MIVQFITISPIYSQSLGDFRSVEGGIFGASGNWSDPALWEIYNGSAWIAASGNSVLNSDQYPGETASSLRNVTVMGNVELILNYNFRVNDLTINVGSKISVGSSSSKYLSIYGNLTNNGQLGEINGSDGISLSFEKDGTSIVSGSGFFDLKRIIKGISNVTTSVIFNADVNVHYSLTAIYNALNNSRLNINVSSGKTLNVVNGSISMDDISGTGSNEIGGSYNVSGTLNVANTVYLTTNNTVEPCSLVVQSGGKVICANVVSSASGAAGQYFILNSGSTFEINTNNLGEVSTVNNHFTLNGEVKYTGSDQEISSADYKDLYVGGTGAKSVSANISISGNLTLAGTTTISGGAFIDFLGTGKVKYSGTAEQYSGEELHSASNLSGVIIDNTSDVVLSDNITIAGDLSFLYGNLITNAYKVTLGGTIYELDNSKLIGNLEKTCSSDICGLTFGNIGIELNSPIPLGAGNITVTRISGDNAVVSVGANNSVKKRFVVTSDLSPASNADLTIQWFTSEDNGKGPNDMMMYKYVDTWAPIGNTTDVDGSPREITQSISSIDGTYTASDASNPLPVELTSFTAANNNGSILLKWETATEVNNYGFEIQKSIDNNSNWQKIEFIEGAGNSNSTKQYLYNDKNTTGNIIYYRLKQIDIDGTEKFLDEIQIANELPEKFTLMQNYPNPFNPSTTIKYTIPSADFVSLKVYDILGNEIAELVNEVKSAGTYSVDFNSSSYPGLATGTYIYTIKAGNYSSSKKFLLLK